MKTVTAEQLAQMPSLAPVSGIRCATCGHAAIYDPAGTPWFITGGMAFCNVCFPEDEAEEAVQLAVIEKV